ncbi:MAG: ATP-dependent DNA helicase [Trueperella sp.]|nr:ATP-dependent DNA helicase [Trueperella sp.]
MSVSYQEFVNTLPYPPTAEQQAVICTTEPAIRVVAGAGSGKTATIAQRIAWQVISGNVQPAEVLGLTFTRKAAGELAARVNKQLAAAVTAGLISYPTADSVAVLSADKPNEVADLADWDRRADFSHAKFARPTIATYNSFASDIASAYGMLIGKDPRARLITDAERWQIAAKLVSDWPNAAEFFENASNTTVIDAVLNLAAAIIDHGVSIAEVREFLLAEAEIVAYLGGKTIPRGSANAYYKDWNGDLAKMAPSLRLREKFLAVVESYFAYKEENSLIEFSDQVAWANQILQQVPEVGEQLRSQYRLILLDEFQDTSANQSEFLANAFRGAHSVCAVGDPNQSIYSWRGASANALSDFSKNFSVAKAGELTLSTAFRNSRNILAAANSLTHGKLHYAGVSVPDLAERPGAADGTVEVLHQPLASEANLEMARRIKQALQEADRPLTAAVLCRNSRYIDLAVTALTEVGVPFEIVGGESIILKPEIRLVRALLGVVIDPQRGDLLATVLNFYAIGTADLLALAGFTRRVAIAQEEKAGIRQLGQFPDAQLVEALAELCQVEPPGDMSATGYRRLKWLGELIDQLRNQRHLPIPDVITAAIAALDLFSYARARTEGSARVVAALNAFIELGAQFAVNHPGSQLNDFLAWIDAVAEKEHGGEGESGEDQALIPGEDIAPAVGVVQLLTVHAAKGLEWDIVAIPALVEKEFDSQNKRTERWLVNNGAFPFPLRGDYQYLPQFSLTEVTGGKPIADGAEKAAVGNAYATHVVEGLLPHLAAEERRLAYVAVTRAKDLLLLVSYAAKDELDAGERLAKKKGKSGPLLPSEFLRNICSPDNFGVVIGRDQVDNYAEDFDTWANNKNLPQSKEPLPLLEANLLLGEANGAVSLWPDSIDRSLDRSGQIAAVLGTNPAVTAEPDADELAAHRELVAKWDAAAKLICAQQGAKTETVPVLRPYFTASDVVNLASDREQFLLDQYRPIPQPPSYAARIGTAVHEAIAHHYQAPARINLDEVAVADQMPLDYDPGLTDGRAQELIRRFNESKFADLPQLAVEQALEIELMGRPIRCVIDAVLDTSTISQYPVTIVDWKTGRRPNAELLRAREYQLGIYRVAWSLAHDIPLENIAACFYYLGEEDPDKRIKYVENLSAAEISAVLETLPLIG